MANHNGINMEGKIFGEWQVLKFSEKKNKRKYWLCKCSCGVEKDVDGAELRRGGSTSCGHNKRVDLTGRTFGEWQVLYSSRIDSKNDFKHFWWCKCSCGIEKEVSHGNLTFEISTNCGHINKVYPDIKLGMKFGEWEIVGDKSIRKNRSNYWLCECSCGIEKYVEYKSLFGGISTHCGHRHADNIKKGMVFGRLTIIDIAGKNTKGNKIYLCKCVCGKEKCILGSSLKDGSTQSCGCFAAEEASKRIMKTLSKGIPHFGYKWYFLDDNSNLIKCRSSYEVFFWNFYYYFLGDKSIQYEPKTFVLASSMRYTPDFYIPRDDLWIETKGSFQLNDSSKRQIGKINIFKESHNLKILYWKDIVDFCKLKYKSLKSYYNHAEKEKIKIEDFLGQRMYFQGE